MDGRLTIECDTCERMWTLGCSLTIYEQQSLESRPCPHCGACTLRCQDPPALAGCGPQRNTWTTFVG